MGLYSYAQDVSIERKVSEKLVADLDKFTILDLDLLKVSSDSRQVAYIARSDDEEFVVIDEHEGAHYEYLLTLPVFSPDGKRIAYGVQSDNKRFVVVNGKKGREILNIFGSISFDSPASLHYLAMLDIVTRDLYLIEEKFE